jgi:Yip1 domain
MDVNKIIARAKAILLSPKTEWPVIAAEPNTIPGLYAGYIAVLAAIPPIIAFLSASLIGVSVPFLGSYRVGVGAGLSAAVLTYVMALVGVFVVTLIVDALAPTFGGERNRVQALKVVAYAYTASWVAAIIGIIPGLGLLAALAGLVFGLYLLNLGLPVLMKCPPDKSIPYTAVTVAAAIVVGFILNLVIVSVVGVGMRMGMGPTALSIPDRSSPSGTFASGSAGAKLQSWADRMANASQQVDKAQKSGDPNAQASAVGQLVGAALGNGGKVESLAPDRIKPFLPATLAGLQRTQSSAERNAALGMQISKAEATYSDGASHNLHLEITDTGSLKGLVGFAAGWAGVEQESENDSGYDKTYKSGGQLVHEKWNTQSQSGEYGVVIGDRFTVAVSGNAANIGELKGAVSSVDLSGLESLKKEGVQPN